MATRFLLGIALVAACLPKVEIQDLPKDEEGGVATTSGAAGGAGGTAGVATSTGDAGGAGAGGVTAGGAGGAGVGGAGMGGAGTGGAAGSTAGTSGRGGASAGGAAGGGASGGAGGATGGNATGGNATGGSATGGSSSCDRDAGAVGAIWADWPMPNVAGGGLPNPQSYDLSVQGVVRDNVTGLVWQRTVDGARYSWAGAQNLCATLVLGGCDAWRLPTRVELVSILDYSRRAPAIDPNAFPNTPQEGHWTATTVAAKTIDRWWVDFSTGDVHDDGDVNANLRVRCVH